jgi:uncharacterized hydrophobic protein (TIGR00271 family)
MSVKFTGLFNISQTERHKFCQNIIDSSAPTADFYLLVMLSTLIVAMGLLADNVILVIGGMLVTPLLSPILAIALGILINEQKVIFRSVRIFVISFFFALIVSFLTGVVSGRPIGNIALIGFMRPSLFILLIAIVAGIAASFTWVKPDLNDRLPGVAVTVTLIPPLTATGLALARGEWLVFLNVFNVLLLNVIGIVAASLVVFALMDFYKAKKEVVAEVKLEEKIIKQEKKKK